MKKLIIILALVVLAGTSYGSTALDQDSQELGLSGLVDFDTQNGTLIDARVSYGYFWIDDLEFGGFVGYQDDNQYTEWELGGLAEYNFRLQSPVIPYIGAALSYLDSELTLGATKVGTGAAVGSFNGGVKYFLVENVALSTDFVFRIATDDVFAEKDAMSDTDILWRLGLRFYF